MRLRSRAARRAGLNVLGVLVALVTLFPILWMVSTAFKPAGEIYSLTPHLLPAHPTLGNFRSVIDGKVIGLLDNLAGLILVYTAFSIPVTIWMLRSFVAAVPREMEEAAAIDGAGPMRIFWRIMLPLVAPGLVATSVFAFIFAWNEFIFALTFLGTDTAKYTLPIYVTYFYGRGTVDWGSIMASSTLFTLPVLVFFLIVQRRMTNGLMAGAVKG